MPSTVTDVLDGLSTSVAVKAPVIVAATSSITLAGEQTISGVSVVEGDRVLCVAQDSAIDNGIYNVSTGQWQRAADFDGSRDVVRGTLINVLHTNGIGYELTTTDPVIGETELAFALRDIDSTLRADLANGTSGPGADLIAYIRTTAETSAGVVPLNYAIPSHDILGFIRPQRYGFSTTASAATNKTALDSAKLVASMLGGANIHLGIGTFPCTDWTCDVNNVIVRGEGKNLTLLDFTSATSFGVTFSKGASSIVRGGLQNLGFVKSDTNTKTAIIFSDARQMTLAEIAINSGNWPGSSSIGINTKGRDFISWHDNDVECARPWVIDKNPNAADLHVDLHEIIRTQFATTISTGICVEFSDGVEFTNTRFSTCDFALGKYGVRWNDTTSTIASYDLLFENCRWEQGEDATGFDVDLESTAQTLSPITFRNCVFDTAKGNVKLRQAGQVTFDNCRANGTGTQIDITFTANTVLRVVNSFWQTGGTVTLTNSRVLFSVPNNVSMPTISDGIVGYDGNASRNITVGGAIGQTSFTVADSGTKFLGANTMLGQLQVTVLNADNCFARFNIRGTNNVTAELEDPQALFSATKDNASTTNVYYDGTGDGTHGAGYYLQNKRGSSRNYSINHLGVYS